MSLISHLFSFKSLLLILLFGGGAFALNLFMDRRNNLVQAFTQPVMSYIKLAVYAIAAIAVCLVLWKINYIVEENKNLAVDNAVQLVTIDSMKEADKVEQAVDKINEKKTVDVVEAERKIETVQNNILANSAKREKLIQTTLSGKAKQDALSAERISTLWEIYNTGMGITEPTPQQHESEEAHVQT